ncbi:ATP-binding protein [Rhizobium sp. TRM96647]|uniref:ATP-binding protein n=1 Tax=unclassified Rhizobium TaxID=2613769 RepID=UPI0021E8B126|nr:MULTISPECIES: ATP-binding protein [unclassified Rhizobium]MCV3737467.1 ATP-binding protein [Rhizobium sp. TRM96647]MCV3756443.1 ATP-binding protein [Rhizobium sp. TRM96650]
MQSPRDFSESLYELLPFPVIVTDREATRFFLNEAGRRTFGWEGKGGAHETLPAVLRSDDAAQLLQGLAVSGRGHSHVMPFCRADGSEFEASAHVIALDGADRAGGYALLLRSLATGGSHGEQVMLGSRIYSALDKIPEGVVIFDRNERVVVFNRAFRDSCGAAKHAVRVGVTLESILRANVREGIYKGVVEGTPEAEATVQARLAQHREQSGLPTIFATGDGRWIRAECHATDSGEVIGLRIDVTDLKTIEQELDARQRQYAELLRLLPDQIVRADKDLIIRFCNEPYASFRGTTPEALIGRGLKEIEEDANHAAGLRALMRITPEVPILTGEFRMHNAQGEERSILWIATATFEGTQPVEFVAVGRDVTETWRQHERLEEQALELQRKNEALNQFTATVSHDLKAPIRHIASFAEMIAEDVERGELDELALHADYVRQAARRMQRLVERLLEYAQIAYSIRQVEPVCLDAVVGDAMTVLADHVRETKAEIDVMPLPSAHGDPELLRRLMQNLIGNAIKYRHPDRAPRVRIYGETTADGVRLVVEDEGIGIDPKHAEAVFGLFQRLHQDEKHYGGTGIGLALAKRIVESHSGSILLDTSYRGGARFVVTLPQA